MPGLIDIRSDTVTRPTEAMRRAMAAADVGDDVYGEDPTVNRLQDVVAEAFAQEAALFMPSGTQSNLVALLTHCRRGDEYLVGADAHTYKYEGGGAAVLGGIQPQPVSFGENGEVPLEQLAALIKADDVHFARTRLLCLENTQHGRVQTLHYLERARRFATDHGLALHLDGARLANAVVAEGMELDAVGACCDSLSLCLSKGLGAPVGSVLLGSAAFIHEARRWRKVTGGGLRQAGVIAAAGLLAFSEGFDALAEDHRRARRLAEALTELPGCDVRPGWTQTNMVWLDFADDHRQRLPAVAQEHGIVLSVGRAAGRLVTHRDLDDTDIERVIAMFGRYFSNSA